MGHIQSICIPGSLLGNRLSLLVHGCYAKENKEIVYEFSQHPDKLHRTG